MFNKKVEQLLDFIHCIYPIDCVKFDKDGFSDTTLSFHHMFLEQQLSYFNTHFQMPNICSNEYNIQYIIVSNDSLDHYILGPYLNSPLFENMVENILENSFFNSYTIKQKMDIKEKLLNLPIIDHNTAIQYALMLYYAINDKRVEADSIVFHQLNTDGKFLEKEDPNYYYCYQYEKQTMDDVRQGNTNNLKLLFKNANVIKYRNIYPANSIRSRKDLSLFYLALLTNAAFDGGLDLAFGYGKQAYYTKLIEDTNNVTKLVDIELKMYKDFTQSVKEGNQKRLNKTDFVLKIESYIRIHLEEEITIDSIAKFFDRSPYYLSKRFYKETGIHLKDYINQEKINEAKNRLMYTQDSISQISDSLGFVNVSYFTQLFKKYVKKTPITYRNLRN